MAQAKLRIKKTRVGTGGETQMFVKFEASNGETLGTGETHRTVPLAEESRRAWLRGMVEVLEAEGAVVTLPTTIYFPWKKD